MARSNDSFRERMRQFKLWHWGVFCICGATVSQAVGMAQPPGNSAEAAGRATAVLLFMVAGVILIVLHFVLPRGQRKKPKTVATAGVTQPGLPPRRAVRRAE